MDRINAGKYTPEQIFSGPGGRPAFLPDYDKRPWGCPDLPFYPSDPFDEEMHDRIPIRIKPEVRAQIEALLPEGWRTFDVRVHHEGPFAIEVSGVSSIKTLGSIPKDYREQIQVERDDECDLSGGCCLEPDGSAWIWLDGI